MDDCALIVPALFTKRIAYIAITNGVTPTPKRTYIKGKVNLEFVQVCAVWGFSETFLSGGTLHKINCPAGFTRQLIKSL